MGRPCSGDSQGRRRLDSGWRQALAWCNANHKMTHMAFQEQLDGRAVDWLEKVTDEQYRLMK
jgi:hypothetical protein